MTLGMLTKDITALLGAELEPEIMDPSPEFVPFDPDFDRQWFLQNASAGQYDLNITRAWDSYSGDGVLVTSIDDGFRYTHNDLAANYDTTTDYDYEGNDFNSTITSASADYHGTPVIGIIAADAQNGTGGVGVAHGATIRGFKGFSNIDTQLLDAAGLGNGVGNTNGDSHGGDIVSMSFGWGANVFLNVSPYIDALETASEFGRDGLGQIHVKSNGNSRADANSVSREEATAEGMDSSKYTVSVAALRADGWVTDFSSPGANLLVSAFADNTSNSSSIRTTSANGNNAYTNSFGGTSAAAPQVSGVVALMLEANEDLGWRDVHTILAASARHVGSDVGSTANSGSGWNAGHEQATQSNGSSWFWNGSDYWNGGGMHFSNDYGYGLVDALGAVRLAQTWSLQSTSANETEISLDFDGSGTKTVPVGTGLSYTRAGPDDMVIGNVSVELNFSAARLADLELFLTSAQGTRVQLVADTGDTASFSGRWSFGTTAYLGEESEGNWTVEVFDDRAGNTLQVHDIDVTFSGPSSPSNSETFIITSEYAKFSDGAGRRSIDGGAGVDTINASAAYDSDLIFDLSDGAGEIDGVTVSLANIENLITSDGEDTLIGSDSDNTLMGGRGDDLLQGGAGADRLEGGAGSDTVSYANSRGSLRVDLEYAHINTNRAAGDSYSSIENLLGSQGFDNLRGTIGDNYIFGDRNVDYIFGRRGDDRLDGGIGDDVLLGGVGADALIGGEHRDRAQYSESLTAVLVDLADSARNTSEAAGDTFSGIEDLAGSAFNDALFGDEQDNRLFGREGDDELTGRAGDDYLNGGANNDWLDGGEGDDVLRGGTHADTFVFRYGHDLVEDFSTSQGDLMALDQSVLGLEGLTTRDVVLTFGSQQGDQVVFAFDDETQLSLDNVTTLSGLEDSFLFI